MDLEVLKAPLGGRKLNCSEKWRGYKSNNKPENGSSKGTSHLSPFDPIKVYSAAIYRAIDTKNQTYQHIR